MIYQIIKGKISGDYFVYCEGLHVMRLARITYKMKLFMNAETTLHGFDHGYEVWIRKR